jgi:hypothetical protein
MILMKKQIFDNGRAEECAKNEWVVDNKINSSLTSY